MSARTHYNKPQNANLKHNFHLFSNRSEIQPYSKYITFWDVILSITVEKHDFTSQNLTLWEPQLEFIFCSTNLPFTPLYDSRTLAPRKKVQTSTQQLSCAVFFNVSFTFVDFASPELSFCALCG
jgi:hypothetical protein